VIVGSSTLAFQGNLIVVLYLMMLPTLILALLGWMSRNIFFAIGGAFGR
jgi:formate hydrogenlyase subunit 4